MAASELLPTHRHEPLDSTPPAQSYLYKGGLVITGLVVLSTPFMFAGISSPKQSLEMASGGMPEAQSVAYAYNSFNKWTFTASAPEQATENAYVMWWGLNMFTVHRNLEKETFMLVGPTGCNNASSDAAYVKRSWVGCEYTGSDIGGNQIHWVYDNSANNEASEELTVKAWHTALKAAHKDLTGEPDQFMDDRHTYARSLFLCRLSFNIIPDPDLRREPLLYLPGTTHQRSTTTSNQLEKWLKSLVSCGICDGVERIMTTIST